ncbi:hypothetical protein IW261DRAFT_1572640 [Armillaria novae-zelandiae]|uniref:CCHC-type domain-containing protein n=1 Tax=Armillaria novae-zelandiae TaxID=153914 RepID=A0AA39NSH0_9AGAR|nr:hypothetical protein IW261DRAFT_1572640 [Armillaria novae-zelandiae]
MPPRPQPIPAGIQHRRPNYYQNVTPRPDKNQYEDDDIYSVPVTFRPPVPGSQRYESEHCIPTTQNPRPLPQIPKKNPVRYHVPPIVAASGPSDYIPQPSWNPSLSSLRLPSPVSSSGSEYTSIATEEERSEKSNSEPDAHHERAAQEYQFGTLNPLNFLGTHLPCTIPTIPPPIIIQTPSPFNKKTPSPGRKSTTTGATTAPAPGSTWGKKTTPPPVEGAAVPIPVPRPSYPAAPRFIPEVLTPMNSMLSGILAPMSGYTGTAAEGSQGKGKQKEDTWSDVEVPYGELRARAKRLLRYQEWFQKGNAGVAYREYSEAGEYAYTQYIIDTEASQHAAIQWNLYHPERPIEVPAGTPPPFQMRGARAKAGHTGKPFGGADNEAPGPANPEEPNDPHPWGPVVNLPTFPPQPGPPVLPEPWEIGLGAQTPYHDFKPKIVREPAPFEGNSNDIMRFFNQCEMYFEAHDRHFQHHPHKVVFCVSRFDKEGQIWWGLQIRGLRAGNGQMQYPEYATFKAAVLKRFWKDADEKIKRAQWKKLKQKDYSDGELFFQKFEELALEAGVIDNEQMMLNQIEEAARQTSKDKILYNDAEQPRTYEHNNHKKTDNKQSSSRKSYDHKKTSTGTTYTGSGQPMDIGKLQAEGKCFNCSEKGHMSQDCKKERRRKPQEEICATKEYWEAQYKTAEEETAASSKVEEVKDEAGQ